MPRMGFMYSADADACNVARVSCNVAGVSCKVGRVSIVMLHVFPVTLLREVQGSWHLQS